MAHRLHIITRGLGALLYLAPGVARTAPAQEAAEIPPAEDDGDWEFEIEDISDDPEALEADLKEGEVQATGKVGAFSGVVTDTKGDPIPGAHIEVVGKEYVGRTGIDGKFKLDLPPGTYTIVVREELHQAVEQPGVTITTGDTIVRDFKLKPQAQALVVQVEADANVEGEAGVMIQRQKEVTSSDRMSAEEISRSGGGSLANVARFIVGATVIDGRFVFVRGLGHRYGNTLLDGARVPSPEPDLRTVPLDIFPSGALGAVNIQKSFSPDVPGDFAGGSIQLVTREIPREPLVTASVELGANTATTGRPMVHNAGFPAEDFFGFGNLPRGLPSELPGATKVGYGLTDENFNPVWTAEEIERDGESLYTDYRVRRGRRGPANGKFKLTMGNSWSTRRAGRVGVLVSGEYANQRQNLKEVIRIYGGSGASGELDTAAPQVDFKGFTTTQTVRWSSLGLARWDITDHHRIEWTSLYSRDADDETREQRGIAPNSSGVDPILTTRLRYVMRSIWFNRLGARHRFPIASGKHRIQLDYFASYSQAQRDDPGIRSNIYRAANDCDLNDVEQACDGNLDTSLSGSAAGEQIFMHLRDDNLNGALNLEVPFDQWSGLATAIKVGGWAEGKWRDFGVRRFDFRVAPGFNDDIPGGTGNVINDPTIGGGVSKANGGTQPWVLRELTRAADNYRASQDLFAGYAMLTLPFVNWFKISGGARLEWSQIGVRPFDLFESPDAPDPDCAVDTTHPRCLAVVLTNLNVLPAAALIFSPDLKSGRGAMNIRLMGSKTVARPEFRELAPFAFTDFVGGFTVRGNEDLKSTDIWNAELRWEWFPRPTEVIAVTGFYKNFQLPIEQVVNSQTPAIQSFVNARAATNVGAELELRKTLGFLARKGQPARKVLRRFGLGSNFAYVFSRVDLFPPCVRPGETPPMSAPNPEEFVEREDCKPEIEAVTSRRRPLQGQSPYVFNVFFDYNNEDTGTFARVLFNTFGRRIFSVSTQGLPDIYEEPVHGLDVILSQRLFGVRRGRTGDLRHQLQLDLGASNVLNSAIQRTQGNRETLTYSTRRGISFGAGLTWRL